MKKTEKVPSHLNQIITYSLLLLASVIIGLFSPHGMLKSILTLLFMFISTYGIQTAVVAIKPLISNATRYGKKHLKKSNLIDRKMMNINIIEGDAISTGMILLGFLQIFVINYFIQRYTGIQLLDGYIIMFWALLQLGIRITNYFFRYKTGEKLQEIKMFLENLDVNQCELASDHFTNYIWVDNNVVYRGIYGMLPEDKQDMLDILNHTLDSLSVIESEILDATILYERGLISHL